jgi:Signal transduction histidine kinase
MSAVSQLTSGSTVAADGGGRLRIDARWRIAAVAVTIVLLLFGALAFAMHNRGGSARASAHARQHRQDTLAAEQAVSAFWEERAAMNAWLAFPSRDGRAYVSEMRLGFRRALAVVQTRSPAERTKIEHALAANEVMVAIFNVQAPASSAPRDKWGVRFLNGAAASVLAPIARVNAGDRREYQRAEAVAASAERARFRSELAAALLALAAIALFAVFAVRLVVRIENQKVKLENQNVELRLADIAKDKFIGTVSHEFRTPLTSMHGFVELLLDESGDPLTEEQRTHLATVQRGSLRLEGLVNDLLLTAQLQAGPLEMQMMSADAVEIARLSVESAQAHAGHKGLRLSLSAPSNAIPIDADAIRLAQAFDNLISNAIKFTPTGGRVDVAVAQARDRTTLTVSDTGMGLTAAEIERLFEPFFRTDSAKQIQGTGLGLPIVKAIVEAHDGTINITSEPNIGTSFTISLPLARPLEHPDATTQQKRLVAT